MRESRMSLVLIAILLTAGIVFFLFTARRNEDTWICENNQWVKHGNPSGPSPATNCGSDTTSTSDAIAEKFNKKYNRPTDDIVLEVETDTGLYAKGSVSFKGEMGGGLWFGAKTANGWELAYDGQGIMSCEIANRYNFPTTIVSGCIDTQNENAFIER